MRLKTRRETGENSQQSSENKWCPVTDGHEICDPIMTKKEGIHKSLL